MGGSTRVPVRTREMEAHQCEVAEVRLSSFATTIVDWLKKKPIDETRIVWAKGFLLDRYMAERNNCPSELRDRLVCHEELLAAYDRIRLLEMELKPAEPTAPRRRGQSPPPPPSEQARPRSVADALSDVLEAVYKQNR